MRQAASRWRPSPAGGARLQDCRPDGALSAACGRAVDGEITWACRAGHARLVLGLRTDPLGVGFSNGTVAADDVEIGVDVIGGMDGVGEMKT